MEEPFNRIGACLNCGADENAGMHTAKNPLCRTFKPRLENTVNVEELQKKLKSYENRWVSLEEYVHLQFSECPDPNSQDALAFKQIEYTMAGLSLSFK